MKFNLKQKQQHVTAWRQSGLPQRSYCQQHGINPNSFKNWPGSYAVKSPTCVPVTIIPTLENNKEIILEHRTGVRVVIPVQQLPTVLKTLLTC